MGTEREAEAGGRSRRTPANREGGEGGSAKVGPREDKLRSVPLSDYCSAFTPTQP